MAVPKKKTSQHRKRTRHSMRQRLQLKKLENRVQLVKSADSGEYAMAHHVCLKSGMYKGKQVLTIKAKGSKSKVVDA
ncbi:50S ribosomal protein L32 [Patescibacteria group bacterium]|jgi:large subunit ribosomal protein L32|nr:50S ribosomal protein L32 [Patescibacteria group bacterium]